MNHWVVSHDKNVSHVVERLLVVSGSKGDAELTGTLGLDWQGMSGEPNGSEVADDCAEALWAAGFRLLDGG